MATTQQDIHTCSYYCTRPACVLAQRNALRDDARKRENALHDLLDALQEFATQYACGCGHPACNNCRRDRLAAEAIAKAQGVGAQYE